MPVRSAVLDVLVRSASAGIGYRPVGRVRRGVSGDQVDMVYGCLAEEVPQFVQPAVA